MANGWAFCSQSLAAIAGPAYHCWPCQGIGMARKKNTDNRWNDIDGGSAFVIPYTMLRHQNFIRLSAYANKLVMDIARQYTGFNNGFLCASWSLMKDAGWRSSVTLMLATLECEHYGIILRTQQGGRNRPNLHALTWRRIDTKPGRTLQVSPSMKPGDEWKIERPEFVRPERKLRRSRRLKAVA